MVLGDVMKRFLLLSLMLFFLTSCKKDDKIVRQMEINFDNDYYQVATPYKSSVGNNYVVNNVLNNYNINDIEEVFTMISSNYFKPSNLLYQTGQYLDQKELKELLSTENLNKAETLSIDDISINPVYLSSIYEQNYLTNNGDLKGITIGLIFNPYQAYKNEFGSYNYKTIELDVLEPIIISKANEIVKYLRDKSELNKIKLVIGVYLQNKPNAILPGSIKYIGVTEKKNIELTKINYEYQYLNSKYALEYDFNTYNAFLNLEKQLKKFKDIISISGKGLYYDDVIQNIEMTVYSGVFNKGELLYLCEMISKEMINFDNHLNIKVYVKSNDTKVAFIKKESHSLKSNINILDG